MFVAEAPRRQDDALGVPLTGRSGVLLDELLAEVGLRRDEVFVTTALKCRPKDNRDPAPQESWIAAVRISSARSGWCVRGSSAPSGTGPPGCCVRTHGPDHGRPRPG